MQKIKVEDPPFGGDEIPYSGNKRKKIKVN